MSYRDDQLLPLSALQRFSFCRREFALTHIEDMWVENRHTIEGDLFHERAHNSKLRERRGDILILRELSVFSHELGLSGKCDVVEFHADPAGVPLQGERGKWMPFPVEYKKGAPKTHDADKLQLCAQAICLEEMLCCEIPEGALFYGKTEHRYKVVFDHELQEKVRQNCQEMHEMFQRGHTPIVKPTKSCRECALKNVCLPRLPKAPKVSEYLHRILTEEDSE